MQKITWGNPGVFLNLEQNLKNFNKSSSVELCLDGGEATLDLLYGHLRTSKFRPVRRLDNGDGVFIRPNWFMHHEAVVQDTGNFVFKIQPFIAGGYEAIVSKVDLLKVSGRTYSTGKKRKKRSASENITEQKQYLLELAEAENQRRSIARAKKQLRLKIKSMGCDRLLTLTFPGNSDIPKSREKTLDCWKSYIRQLNRLVTPNTLEYVAVLEKQKNGNYHIHAALNQRININHANRLWQRLSGAKNGCDIAYKPNITPHQRRAGLAKYVSKYLNKQFEDSDFNKKRFFASKHEMLPVRRYVLAANDGESAFIEVCAFLGLDKDKAGQLAYFFPGTHTTQGFWLNYDDRLLAAPPF